MQSDELTFQVNFDAATYARVIKTGVADSREVRVAVETTELCVMVRDLFNGNMGSVYVPLSECFHPSIDTAKSQDERK